MSPLPAIHRVVTGFFSALADYSISHPRRVIVAAVALTLAVAPGALRLKLRTDGHALVDDNAPEVREDRRVREQFGIEDPVVVLLHAPGPDGIYNPATLQLVRELTAEFARMPGINSNKVTSLATQRSFRSRPGSLQFQTLLENPARTPGQLEELRADIRRIDLYTGTIVSFDEKSTAILIGTPAGADRTALYKRVHEIVGAHGGTADELHVTGPPVAEALLGTHILEDLGVPTRLLGATTHERAATLPAAGTLHGLRMAVARHAGLLPISVLVMALVFQVSFRRIVATLLPMAEVGACLAFTFGLMGFFDVPVYLTIAVMPVLLTAMAVTDEIHVYSRYFALLHDRPRVPHVILAREAIAEMVCPVVNTSLTTAVGFVSFAFSPLAPVRAFGVFTGIGVLFCLFWSLSVMPALLALTPPCWVRSAGKGSRQGESAAFRRFAQWGVRQRWRIVGAALLVIAATPLGLRRLAIQDSWIDGFDPDSDFSRATRLVNRQFHGMHLLHLVADGSEVFHGTAPASAVAYSQITIPTNGVGDAARLPGRWLYLSIDRESNQPPAQWRAVIDSVTTAGGRITLKTQQREPDSAVWTLLPRGGEVRYEIVSQPMIDHSVLATLSDLGRFIEQHKELKVGKVLTPGDFVATTRFMVRPNEPGSRFVPTNAAEIKLMWDFYRIVRGDEQLRQIVDTNYARSLLTVFLKEANFADTEKLMREIRSYEREQLAPRHIKLTFAGDVAVSQSLIRGIVTTQMQSLFGSLVGIYLVTALLGRSLRWGVFAVVPCALSVLVNFAAMGWLGIPLGVATSMFAAMTLGIGVDFAIHVVEGFTFARAEGMGADESIAASLARIGLAVVINTVAIALGFGVLMLSQVPANARLGALTILGLVNCLAASLLLLPALLHWWPLKAGEVKSSVKSPATELA